MTTIIDFLSDKLSELEDAALVAVSVTAQVEAKIARRAASGEPIKAADALCLLAAIGRDPLTREPIPPRRLGRFNHQTLALFLNMRMRVKKYTVRNVCAETGLSTRSVQNILNAEPVNLSSVVKGCTYLDIHPFDQCERVKQAEAA